MKRIAIALFFSVVVGSCCPKIVSSTLTTTTTDSVPTMVPVKIDSIPIRDSIRGTIPAEDIRRAIESNTSFLREFRSNGLTTRITISDSGNVELYARIDSSLSALDSALVYLKTETVKTDTQTVVYECDSTLHKVAVGIAITSLLFMVVMILIFASKRLR